MSYKKDSAVACQVKGLFHIQNAISHAYLSYNTCYGICFLIVLEMRNIHKLEVINFWVKRDFLT